MENKIGVYQIELNGKKYVGSTTQSFNQRWQQHLTELRKGNHHNCNLQETFNKCGEELLSFSILEIVEIPEEVIVLERKYINELKPEYNISRAGNYIRNKQEIWETSTSNTYMEEIKRRIGDKKHLEISVVFEGRKIAFSKG